VYGAPTPAGGLAIAWTTTTNSLHLTRLDSSGNVIGPDFVLNAKAAHGLVATSTGYALLVQRDPDVIAFVILDLNGNVVVDKMLDGNVDHTVVGSEWYAYGGVSAWLGEGGRVVWDPSTKTYAVYFPVQRHWPDGISHFGDTLRHLTETGDQVVNWGWGCSHSLDIRMTVSGSTLEPVCLSDCYAQKAILLSDATVLSSEPSGNCAGSSAATLGGLVPVSDGFWLSYVSPEGRTSKDVALKHVSTSGTAGSVIWLTNTTGDETSPHLGVIGSDLLALWQDSTGTRMQLLDATGTAVGSTRTIGVTLGAFDDLFSFSNGDAGWVRANGSGLSIGRIHLCL
jgi:hypothetical protein